MASQFRLRLHPDRALEYEHCALMIAWGFWLIGVPGSMRAPPYELLVGTGMTPSQWGAFSAAVGLLRLLALLVNSFYFRTPAFRMLGAFAGMMWWATLAALFMPELTQGPGPAISFIPVFFCAEVYNVFMTGAAAQMSGSFAVPRWLRASRVHEPR